MRAHWARDGKEVSAAVAGSDQTGLAKLTALWRVYAQIVTADFGRCPILVGEDTLPKDARKDLRTLKGRIDERFRSIVQEGIADGSIRPCDPKLAAFTAAGALSWIALVRSAGTALAGRTRRPIIDLLIHGVGAGQPPRPAA